jgi:pimeloyl-ACP methyl ester carboxylesterase
LPVCQDRFPVWYAKAEVGLSNDVVVVVPGVMGSRLRTVAGHEVWGPGAGSILRALATLGGSLRDLTLPADIGDGPAPDGVQAFGVMPSLHVIPGIWTPIQGYSELVQFLKQSRFGLVEDRGGEPGAPAGNLVVLAYDWRLSNRHSAHCLKDRAESALERWRASDPTHKEAQLVFICHSMGGLVARWYIEKLGGKALTRLLVTLGTPHRGACKSLSQLVNGVRKGPLKTDLTDFARSLPSSYQLLPEYACIDRGTADLAKTIEVELPHLDKALVADGMRFHDDLDDHSEGAQYPVVPMVGIGQPTWTTARIDDERLTPLDTIGDRDLRGDGTVPRLSARPKGMDEHDRGIRGLGEGHGLLAAHRSVTDQLDFLLTSESVRYRGGADIEPDEAQILGVSTLDLHEVGEPMSVVVRAPTSRLIEVVAIDERGDEAARELVAFTGTDDEGAAVGTATFANLDPGGYAIGARAPGDPRGYEVAPVHTTTLVLA